MGNTTANEIILFKSSFSASVSLREQHARSERHLKEIIRIFDIRGKSSVRNCWGLCGLCVNLTCTMHRKTQRIYLLSHPAPPVPGEGDDRHKASLKTVC